jgi:hypothetical protein
MPIESATYVSQLAPANPLVGDDMSQGDDHLRLIKSVLQATLPNASKAFYFPTSTAEQAGDVNVQSTDAGKVFPVSADLAARTVNLPATPADGFEVTIVKSDASVNLVTIDPAGAALLNGVATKALTFQYESMRCIYLATFAAWIGLRSSQGTPFDLSQVLPVANGGTGVDTAYEAFDAISPAGVTIASASTVDLDAAQSSYVFISGTTTIANITLAAGRKRWVVFTGALQLTHSGSLRLPSEANITTVAGDRALFIGEAAGVVRCLFYQRIDGLPVATQPPARAYAEYTANTSLSGSIPQDNTKPQSNEGDQILTASITLTNAASRVRVRFSGWVSRDAEDRDFTIALFNDQSTDALNVAQIGNSNDTGTTRIHHLGLEFEHAPGAIGPFVYQVRAGVTAGNYSFNGNPTGTAIFGGASRATLTLEEVFV